MSDVLQIALSFLAGLFIGVNFGVFVIAICGAASRGDGVNKSANREESEK